MARKCKFSSLPSAFCALMVLAIVVCSINSAYSSEKDSGLINIKVNAKMPSFVLQDTQTKKPVKFNTTDGKPSLISFFSLNPPYRQKRALNLLEIQAKIEKKFGDRIHSVAVFSSDQESNTLQQFINDGLITVQVLDDSKRVVHEKFGVYMMPITILLGSDSSLHAVIPFTGGMEELLSTNLQYLLGDLTGEQLKESLNPVSNLVFSKEEKEYVRRVNYGRVMLARKMYSAAVREFSTAVKIQPKSIEAFIGLGNSYLKAKKYTKAELNFQKALKINKESDEALSGLGICLYQQGKLSEALPILENALITEQPLLDVVVILADIYEQQGKILKAMRLNKLAISRLIQRFE